MKVSETNVSIILLGFLLGFVVVTLVALLTRTSRLRELQEQTERNWKKLDDLQNKAEANCSQVEDLRYQTQQANEKLAAMEKLQAVQINELKAINETTERRLLHMEKSNEEKLDQMRQTVDEKLQKTLEDRLSQSFKQVSDQLEQVYKGLGEMQNLAAGVGDLKKVLSGVKTRGILGEIQLGAILEQLLPRERYVENVVTKRGATERVEFAICLPGEDEQHPVLLPVDAKFPADAYAQLRDAQDAADKEEILAAGKQLEQRIKGFAKDIHDKYIDPPYTTDFGIMFLPIEGLYAEVVQRGLLETLQREYKITIAGPSTMAAMLNSLQMGFKTLAIQKHTNEVWAVLAGVQKEFDTFGTVLEKTQERLHQADDELEKLVGVRTRKIQSTLKKVQRLEGSRNSIDGVQKSDLLDLLDEPEEAE